MGCCSSSAKPERPVAKTVVVDKKPDVVVIPATPKPEVEIVVIEDSPPEVIVVDEPIVVETNDVVVEINEPEETVVEVIREEVVEVYDEPEEVVEVIEEPEIVPFSRISLTLRFAHYGKEDVTEQVAEILEGGTKTISDFNDTFGDNWPGVPKKLSFKALKNCLDTDQNETLYCKFSEGEEAVIVPEEQNLESVVIERDPDATIVLYSAEFVKANPDDDEFEPPSNNLTGAIVQKYRNDEKIQWATNDYWERGFDIEDPCPGHKKQLVIEFFNPDVNNTVTEYADEWTSIELPDGFDIRLKDSE